MNASQRNSSRTSRYSRPHDDESREKRPLPPEVYKRRRIAALIAVIVVIALLWWLLSSLAGSKDDTSDQAADVSATSSSPNMTGKPEPPNKNTEESTEPSEDKDSSSENASSSTSSDPASDKTSCELSDLHITAVPGSNTFGAEEQPNFFAKIQNPTKADCEIDVDEDALKFEVFALNDYHRVWGDLDCNRPSLDGTVTIAAGEEKNYEMGAWSRTVSAPEQCDNRQPVDPGSYLLYAHLGDKVSEPATFNLQ